MAIRAFHHHDVSAGAPSPASGRSGITLVEVLIAIGVVAIGLLGVITLLPLGLHEARQGTIADRAAIVGRRAVREFRTRGMDRWDNWYASGINYDYTRSPSDQPQTSFPPPFAFAIDPRFVARQSDNYFPYSSAGSVSQPMRRISLQTFPGSGKTMGLYQADEIFLCHDDLEFALPDAGNKPPVQQDEIGNGAAGSGAEFGWNQMWAQSVTPKKRRAASEFSWMATVVPEMEQSGYPSDLYTVSIVVFYQRDNAMVTNGRKALVTPNELVVDATILSGIGGVDATLTIQGVSRERADVVFDVRQDQWLMLVGTGTGAGSIPLYKWYRIAAVGAELYSDSRLGAGLHRDVTLAGPDWDTVTTGNAKAVLIRGAVAVFEKTVRLKTASLWTQDEF